jgi:hypothetical protein
MKVLAKRAAIVLFALGVSAMARETLGVHLDGAGVSPSASQTQSSASSPANAGRGIVTQAVQFVTGDFNALAATDGPNPFRSDQAGGPLKLGLPIFSSNATLSPSSGGGIIVTYLRDVLRLLSSIIGVVIVLMIVIGGVQYMTSLGDPKAVASAKNRITNAIIALVLFLMTFAIISFLVPGGIVG